MGLNFSTCHCPLAFDLHMSACVGLHPPHSYICTQNVDNRQVENGPYSCIEHVSVRLPERLRAKALRCT